MVGILNVSVEPWMYIWYGLLLEKQLRLCLHQVSTVALLWLKRQTRQERHDGLHAGKVQVPESYRRHLSARQQSIHTMACQVGNSLYPK